MVRGLRGLAPVAVLVIVLVTIAVTATATYLVVTYLNQVASVSVGRGVAGIASVSFSDSYNDGPIRVGLSNGLTANTMWDGKAVGVVGYGGTYVRIRGAKYYVAPSSGYGVKASNQCPWYAPITGATLYDVKIVRSRATHKPLYDAVLVQIDGPRYVELENNNNLVAVLSAIGAVYSPNGQKIKMPITGRTYNLWGLFEFYYGSTGLFGGCPQLSPHHEAMASGTIHLAVNS